jgi:predicted nucleic acid-binding protein
MSTRTFVDAGVLLAAARAIGAEAEVALQVLDDPDREFVSSLFLRLEVLPRAVYAKNMLEAEFYQVFFDSVKEWADDLEAVTDLASTIASDFGLGSMDALHVAAALTLGAQEIVTAQPPDGPIHRVGGIKVTSIRA